MPEYIQLNKEVFDLLMDLLDIKKPKCDFCRAKMTKDNFGLIHADVKTCGDLLCQIQGMDKIKR